MKGDPNTNFNIDINKRVAAAPDMEQRVTEKVCRTFGITSRDVQNVLFYENRYAGTWQHGKVGGHMFGRIEKKSDEKAADPSAPKQASE